MSRVPQKKSKSPAWIIKVYSTWDSDVVFISRLKNCKKNFVSSTITESVPVHHNQILVSIYTILRSRNSKEEFQKLYINVNIINILDVAKTVKYYLYMSYTVFVKS